LDVLVSSAMISNEILMLRSAIVIESLIQKSTTNTNKIEDVDEAWDFFFAHDVAVDEEVVVLWSFFSF
jgi:hypothetical protein